MKTKEELNILKNEIESLNKKLAELTEDELAQVLGGIGDYEFHFYKDNEKKDFKPNFDK